MLPVPKIVWLEMTSPQRPARITEPEAMTDAEQVASYVKAYEWGGPTSALQLHHMRELASLIRPGDVVVDLACGPGPLLLELAPLYPEVEFIGADLSPTMLEHLQRAAREQGLPNVSVLQEDIRTLPSLEGRKVDLVISTSALHHLPDEDSLRQVFTRMNSLLGADGGFYLFDFGLLRSARTREIFVAEVAKLAPPITAHDYDVSLQAAYPVDFVLESARAALPRPYVEAPCAFVDFFYFLQTAPRTTPSPKIQARLDEIWRGLSVPMKAEHAMLRMLRRRREVR